MTSPTRLVLSVLAAGLACCGAAGCGAATGRPDAELARVVDQEERRLAAEHDARLDALVAADLASLELAAAGAAVDTLALLYVPSPAAPAPAAGARPSAAPAADDESDPNWVQGPPPSWLDEPWPHSQAMDPDGGSAVSGAGRGSGGGGGDGPVSLEGGGRRERKASKPKIRMSLFNMNFRGRPVSFSGSLKGLKGVQFKATIKM